jgi:hypothetical protein
LITHTFANYPYLAELGELINRGDQTTEEIIDLMVKFGQEPANTMYSLNLLLSKGVLDD